MRRVEETDVDASLDVDALQAVLREHPVGLAILFGSHATGTAHSASDIDIAIEFASQRPADPGYNDAFLGLGADLSAALETDDVDLVDLHAVSPPLATSIFDDGILLRGDAERAAELRRQIGEAAPEAQSPRERFDSALDRIDVHLDGDDGAVSVPADSKRDE